MNLTELCRTVISDSSATDPRVIAKEVASRVAKADLLEALEVALVPMVRTIGGLPRSTGSSNGLSTATAQATPGRSRKLDAARHVARLLDSRIAVGDNDYRQLGDMTAAEVSAAALIRENHAAANTEAAKRLRKIERRMRQTRAAIVRDLPASELLAVWS